VLLIHGNSASKEVFAHQYGSHLAQRYRFVALDLPGHGASENASDPARTYNFGGYSELCVELMGKLRITRAAVLGWSLGGHIGLEMIARFPGLTALMIVGSPPFTPEPSSIGEAFRQSSVMGLAGKEVFASGEAYEFACATHGVELPEDADPVKACARTHGLARKLMFESVLSGRAQDEIEIVASMAQRLAVLNGAKDPIVNVDYISKLRYGNLWDGVLYVMSDAGHACFWQKPEVFNPIFGRFLDSLA
jgi:pimeloyl-ACP methyl ester carboxylesterase